MGPGASEWRLADGTLREVGPAAVFGRGPAAHLRIDDPRVSTVHAELSWRPEGLTLLARGGRLRVDGRGVLQVLVTPGLRVELAPGLVLEAVTVERCADQVVPDTDGRRTRRYAVGETSTVVFDPDLPPQGWLLGGVAGHLLASLVRAGERGEAWDVLACRLWPDDARIRATPAWTSIDERRLRNRFDQHLRMLRLQLDGLKAPPAVEVTGGVVRVHIPPEELIETA